MTSVEQKLLLSPEAAAELLDIGRTQLFELISRGEIESVKIGWSRKIPREALTAYVARLRAKQAAAAAAIA